MSYFIDHGTHYIGVSEYRIARYCCHPVKLLNSAVISVKSALEHRPTCIYVYVRVCLDVGIIL